MKVECFPFDTVLFHPVTQIAMAQALKAGFDIHIQQNRKIRRQTAGG